MYAKLIAITFFAASASTAFAGKAPPPTITTTTTQTDASVFLGLSWTFGGADSSDGTAGLTLKLLSTNKRNAPALAGGVTYNFDGTFGCDLGLGYNMSGATLTASYDFCKQGPQLSLGGTKKPDTVTTTTTPGLVFQ